MEINRDGVFASRTASLILSGEGDEAHESLQHLAWRPVYRKSVIPAVHELGCRSRDEFEILFVRRRAQENAAEALGVDHAAWPALVQIPRGGRVSSLGQE